MQNNFVQQVWRLFSSAIRFSSSPRYFFMTKGTNKQKIWWYSDTIIINGRVFRTPYFMKTPCILFIFPFLKFYPTTPLFLLLCFFGWMCHKVSSCHIQCIILIHDFMDLNLLGLRWCLITSSTLLCFMKQGINFTEGLTLMTWFLLLLWFDIKHTDKHTYRTRRDQ